VRSWIYPDIFKIYSYWVTSRKHIIFAELVWEC
jgi:hypothetical protein